MIDLREICKERRWIFDCTGLDDYWFIMCEHGEIYSSGMGLAVLVKGHTGIRLRLLRAGFVSVQGDSVFEFGLNQLDEVAAIVKPEKLGGRLLTPEEREASAKRLSKYQFQAATVDKGPPQSENKTITIDQLMNLNPCYDRERILEIANGKTEMTAAEILDLDIDADDRLWLLLREHFFSESDLRMMAAAFADQSLKYFERKYPGDDRPRDAIMASRLFTMGEIDTAAWSAARDAARSAARSAARDAARTSARSAAWSAARSAAWSTASSAAWSAARDAARSAAMSAAWSAAWDAAMSAAWSAAWSAARSAAWSAQIEIVRLYIAE